MEIPTTDSNQQQAKTVSLNADVLDVILGNLEGRYRDLARLARVNRLCYQLSLSHLYKNLAIGRCIYGIRQNDRNRSMAASGHGVYAKNAIWYIGEDNDMPSILQVIQSCSQIRSLCINYECLPDDFLLSDLAELQTLQTVRFFSFEVYGSSVRDDSTIVYNVLHTFLRLMPKLEYLYLYCHARLGQLKNISLPNLKHLDYINQIAQLSTLHMLLPMFAQSLQTLSCSLADIEEMHQTPAGLQVLHTLRRLNCKTFRMGDLRQPGNKQLLGLAPRVDAFQEVLGRQMWECEELDLVWPPGWDLYILPTFLRHLSLSRLSRTLRRLSVELPFLEYTAAMQRPLRSSIELLADSMVFPRLTSGKIHFHSTSVPFISRYSKPPFRASNCFLPDQLQSLLNEEDSDHKTGKEIVLYFLHDIATQVRTEREIELRCDWRVPDRAGGRVSDFMASVQLNSPTRVFRSGPNVVVVSSD